MGKVIAVCTSERKGIQKTSVPEIKVIEDWGIEGDAHAGKWHRQVSLLSFDKIEDFRARGAEVEDGAFGENLVVQGIDFATLPIVCSNLWNCYSPVKKSVIKLPAHPPDGSHRHE